MLALPHMFTCSDIPVPCGCNEVQQNVHTVVAESGVTLNTRFLCENVIVLTLEVADDLSKAAAVSEGAISTDAAVPTWPRYRSGRRNRGYRRWSVRCVCPPHQVLGCVSWKCSSQLGSCSRDGLTDCDGLNLDALLDVGGAGVVRLLVLEHWLAAECVDECCAAC